MMIFFYIAIVLLLLYGILFQYYGSWWKQIPEFNLNDFKDWKPSVKISVIIPARNEEKNIAACLHSVCKQNHPPNLFQVIVIDDGSADDTFTIASSIACDGIQIICYQLPTVNKNTAPKK